MDSARIQVQGGYHIRGRPFTAPGSCEHIFEEEVRADASWQLSE